MYKIEKKDTPIELRPPVQVGAYLDVIDLKNKIRVFHDNFYSAFKQLKLPNHGERINFDLTEGFERYNPYFLNSAAYDLNSLLKWIMKNYEKFLLINERHLQAPVTLNTDFVCYRGSLTKIMCFLFSKYNFFRIQAVKFKETIYLLLLKEEESVDLKQLKLCYSGHRFEDYIITNAPNRDNEEKLEKRDFCCVYRSRLGSHSICYGAEIDCFVDLINENKFKVGNTEASKLKAVEIKTRGEINNLNKLYGFKFMQWWAQSYLVSCKYVVCGIRDDQLRVKKLEQYTLPQLVQVAKFWNPKILLNSLNDFFNLAKDIMKSEQNRCLEFKFDNGNIYITKNDFDFLPDWYKKSFL